MADTTFLAQYARERQNLRNEDVAELLEKEDEQQSNDQPVAVPAVITMSEEVDIPMVGRCTRMSHCDATTGEVIGIEYANRPPAPSEVVASGSGSRESDVANSCSEDHPVAIPFPPSFGHVPPPRPA